MANVYGYEVLRDTTQLTVIKLTAKFDGTGQEANTARIQANTLNGALATNGFMVANTQGGSANTALSYYDLQLRRIGYNIASQQKGYVDVYWAGLNGGANNSTIVTLDLSGEYSEDQGMVSLRNNAISPNGDIGITTYGFVANCAYTMILELRKNNAMYQRGQFNDPAAFNYNPYNINP